MEESRSFKDVVIGHNPFGEPNRGKLGAIWKNRREGNEVDAPDDDRERMGVDELDIGRLVRKVVEEIFKSENLEKLKQEIRTLLEEEMWSKVRDHRKAVPEKASERKKEQTQSCWEEELVLSMKHNAQGGAEPLRRTPDPALAEESSRRTWAVVGPLKKCVEEVNGATEVDHPHLSSEPCPKELGREGSSSTGPEYPPGFENIVEVGGPSNQTIMQRNAGESGDSENYLEKRREGNQSSGDSHGATPSSVEEVPQTPVLELSSNRLNDDLECGMPSEEDLVEARIAWEVGKTLGCKVSNDEAMIRALANLPEHQDFILPRKRGRPRKNKS